MHILYSTTEVASYFAWDDFVANLDAILDARGTNALLVGTIQRWDGKFSCGCLLEQAKDILSFLKDCETIVIYEDDAGHLMVKASHHDGVNCAEIRILTNNGMLWYEEHENTMPRRALFEGLFTTPAFSTEACISGYNSGRYQEALG